MKVIRASRKIERAIDALIDLQQDYADECEAAKIQYDLQIILDRLNGLSSSMDAIS